MVRISVGKINSRKYSPQIKSVDTLGMREIYVKSGFTIIHITGLFILGSISFVSKLNKLNR